LPFFHTFPILSLFDLLFFHIFHIISLFSLLFFHIFHIISLFNLLFFHIFHIISLFSSVFSNSFHYSTYLSSIFSKSFHYSTYLSSIFSNVFQLSETSFNSYDISFMYKLPRYNWNIVESGIKHHKPNPLFTKTYTYPPIYLHVYQNYKKFQFLLVIFQFWVSNFHNQIYFT
jgi:hypothetical protein